MKKILIQSLNDINKLLVNEERDDKIDRLRNACYYRGLPNIKFKLETSLYRNCGKNQGDLEWPLIKNFTKYAAIENSVLNPGSSIWEQLIIGQHHGLPTRLMDWTRSPLVALHFALLEDYSEMNEHDAVVWKIDMKEISEDLPKDYRDHIDGEKTHVFSVDDLNSVTKDSNANDALNALNAYDTAMKKAKGSFVLLEPHSSDQRIVNQYSFFAVVKQGQKNLDGYLKKKEKTVQYIINKNIKWDLRDLLDQFNMNERTIFPMGLDGITKVLARRYYDKSPKKHRSDT